MDKMNIMEKMDKMDNDLYNLSISVSNCKVRLNNCKELLGLSMDGDIEYITTLRKSIDTLTEEALKVSEKASRGVLHTAGEICEALTDEMKKLK